MIGILDIQVQAANPQLPLAPIRAYKNSPTSVRVRNVPKAIGSWKITSVQIVALYPDNVTKTADCVLVGGVWVGTIAGCDRAGRTENGFTVFASGIDENGNAVSNYVLGKGLVEILDGDGTIDPSDNSYYVHIYDEEPTSPKDGDVWQISGAWYIYQDNQAWPIGDDSGLIGQLSAEVQDVENELSAKQDSLTGSQISAIDSVVDERKTVFTIYGEPYIVESDIVGELKASDIPTGPNQVKAIKIGTSVTSIGESFSAGGGSHSVQGISSLTIPDTIKTIGNSAFQSCHELSGTLTIPDGVESIGNYAFNECNNLDTIEIPASVKTIGQNAFGFTKARIIFKGRTMAEVSAMTNYPWGYDWYGVDNSKRVTVYATENQVSTLVSSIVTAEVEVGVGDNWTNYVNAQSKPQWVPEENKWHWDEGISLLEVSAPEDAISLEFQGEYTSTELSIQLYVNDVEHFDSSSLFIFVMADGTTFETHDGVFNYDGGEYTPVGDQSTWDIGNYYSFTVAGSIKVDFHRDSELRNKLGLATEELVESGLSAKADASSLSNYVTNDTLSSTLSDYTTQEWVTPRLSYSLLSSGSVQLEDRAVQHVSLELSTTVFTLPQLISGKVNDFVLDVTNTYTEGGTTAAASFSLNGTIGTNFNLVVPKDESFAEMTTLEAGEMAEFYFTRTSFELSGLPTWKVVKQVVDQYTPTAI